MVDYLERALDSKCFDWTIDEANRAKYKIPESFNPREFAKEVHGMDDQALQSLSKSASGGVSLDLKVISFVASVCMRLAVSGKKKYDVLFAIRDKVKKMAALAEKFVQDEEAAKDPDANNNDHLVSEDEIDDAEDDEEDDDAEEEGVRRRPPTTAGARKKRSGTFKKDKNTIPRLLNFMFQDTERLKTCKQLATRMQLQFRETSANNPLYVEAVAKFNNWDMNSGGVVNTFNEAYDNLLTSCSLNPEQRPSNRQFPLTAARAYKMFTKLLKYYALVNKWFSNTGQNDCSKFMNFTTHLRPAGIAASDVLYMHCMLVSIDHSEVGADKLLQKLFSEGGELLTGASSMDPPTPSTISTSPATSRKKRPAPPSSDQAIVDLVKLRKDIEVRRQEERGEEKDFRMRQLDYEENKRTNEERRARDGERRLIEDRIANLEEKLTDLLANALTEDRDGAERYGLYVKRVERLRQSIAKEEELLSEI